MSGRSGWGPEVGQPGQVAGQIEFRWQHEKDLSAIAHSVAPEQARFWSGQLSGLIRQAPPVSGLGVPDSSVAYWPFGDGTAAVIWRLYDEQAIPIEGDMARQPVVARALVGAEDLLDPVVAMALARGGSAISRLDPPPGQVAAGTRLPSISSGVLLDAVRQVIPELDDVGRQEDGAELLVAAALRDGSSALSVVLPGRELIRGLWEGPQLPLLRAVWVTTAALDPERKAAGGRTRGWSFSTFEEPLGSHDTRWLAGTVFRSEEQDHGRPPPPATRPEVTVCPRSAAVRLGRFDEIAEVLMTAYRDLGGDTLQDRLAGIAHRWPDEGAWLTACLRELRPARRQGPAREATRQPADVQAAPPLAPLEAEQPERELAEPAPGDSRPRHGAPARRSLPDILDVLHHGPGHPDFPVAGKLLATPGVSATPQERAMARNLMPGRNWYLPSLRRSDPFHVEDQLEGIFRVAVIPDLDLAGVCAQVSRWAAEAPPEVIRALSAAAHHDGQNAVSSLHRALHIPLFRRWLAEHGTYFNRDSAAAGQPQPGPRLARPAWQLVPDHYQSAAGLASLLIWLCLILAVALAIAIR